MNAPTLAVVVEGRSDAEIVRAVLGKDLAQHVRFFAGKGKTSLASVGRNILVDQGGPILVVMDSDTTNQRMADENKGMMRLALSRFGAPEDYDVFQFVPTIEVVFFEAPAALRQFVNSEVSAEALRDGLLIPKVKLAALRGGEQVTITKGQIDARVGELLAAGQQARAFREVVQRLLTQHAEA